MTYSFDASFFSSEESFSDKRPIDYQHPMTDAMPPHYAWLALNPKPTKPADNPIRAQWLIQKQQQELINVHGLDADELRMMRELKRTLKAETQNLMQRVSHWLEMFDPSLKLEDKEDG